MLWVNMKVWKQFRLSMYFNALVISVVVIIIVISKLCRYRWKCIKLRYEMFVLRTNFSYYQCYVIIQNISSRHIWHSQKAREENESAWLKTKKNGKIINKNHRLNTIDTHCACKQMRSDLCIRCCRRRRRCRCCRRCRRSCCCSCFCYSYKAYVCWFFGY